MTLTRCELSLFSGVFLSISGFVRVGVVVFRRVVLVAVQPYLVGFLFVGSFVHPFVPSLGFSSGLSCI